MKVFIKKDDIIDKCIAIDKWNFACSQITCEDCTHPWIIQLQLNCAFIYKGIFIYTGAFICKVKLTHTLLGLLKVYYSVAPYTAHSPYTY